MMMIISSRPRRRETIKIRFTVVSVVHVVEPVNIADDDYTAANQRQRHLIINFSSEFSALALC